MRWQRAAGVIGSMALLEAAVLAGCTDGVTPDCSDAAAQCGPSAAAAADGAEATAPGTDSAADAAANDGAADAPLDGDGGDAPLDAGDAG